jgi:ribonuclease R
MAKHSRGRRGKAPKGSPRGSSRPKRPGRREREARQQGAGGASHRGEARAPRGAREITGKLTVHRDGFGFVRVEKGEDIYLPPDQASGALNNDIVRVAVVGGPRGTEGRLLEVVRRVREKVVGKYFERPDGSAYVKAAELGYVEVPKTQLARPGDVVKVHLARDAQPGPEGLSGEVAGSLGQPGQPSQEVLSVAFGQGFSDEFPEEVMAEAERIPSEVVAPLDGLEEPEEARRRDLRELPLVTIDGADARDFDDAVYAERSAQGYRLWVAIADVTHYVHEGAPLDVEALRRGTSVYLPDRVLPMLPERLSNGICSLRPEVDRLCLVAEMQFDAEATLGEFELYPAVMRSKARCTYDEVQDVLDGRSVPGRDRFRRDFQVLLDLSRTLRKMRERRGAIDFDLPESRVALDADGFPLRVERRERKESHRLIEECMLAANEAVAKFFFHRELPSVYRFHGEPDADKLAVFAQLAQAYGFVLGKKGVSSKELNAFVKKLEGHPEQRALNQLLLRSMMQAIYSSEQVGHYGLAAEHYLHFTSPIRRYPDLLVHRLLKAHWGRGQRGRNARQLERETQHLEDMAAHSSERERAAMLVEREVSAFYACLLMKGRVGESFDAVVSSITDFGFFVELKTEHVEGLVKAESVGHGARLHAPSHSLVFPSGRKVRVGQELRVRLVEVNLERRQMDFELDERAGLPIEHRLDGGAERSWAPGFRRKEAPREQAPELSARPPHPSRAQEQGSRGGEDAGPAKSPHPGFDRLRALAQRGGPQGKERGGEKPFNPKNRPKGGGRGGRYR